ncbi:MAG: polyprenyl synthetase family protein [Aquificaceae bacterium]
MSVKLWRELIEKRLRELLKPFEPNILYQAMSYYLFQEGKRIRPLLLCAVCDALGGDMEDAITVGCAVEAVHNYSLVHDDLPALDNDAFRRGKPSCHMVFGEDIAILAGDALLTFAFEILSDKKNFKSLSEKELLLLVKELSIKSGYRGMVGGQVLDIRGLSSHEEISLKKTAQLFSFCFLAGGIVAKKYDLIKGLEELGLEFGLIFQMKDDYRDKDGFYSLYGEELLERLKGLSEEYRAHLKGLGLFTEELKELLDRVGCF